MSEKSSKHTVKITLTSEQKEQVRQALGLEVASLTLEPESLEERIAPTTLFRAHVYQT